MKKSIYLFIALMFAGAISKAQSIPNAGFETWSSMGNYSNPDGWGCLNDMTANMSSYTCTKGTPGNPGTGYLKLTSKTISGLGVVPGIAVCGILNTTTMQATSGFAFSQRPQNFTGKWQHMIYGSSQGYIDVQLTRWDANSQSRVIVASKHQVLSGMAMSWANFTMALTYMDGSNPDSCIITMAASGSTPTNNDYLWVDNLAFTGTVTGINSIDISANISVFPIPATDNLTVNLSALQDKNVTIQISDIQGKLVSTLNNVEVSSNVSIDISQFQKGNYVLKVVSSKGTGTINFIKQ